MIDDSAISGGKLGISVPERNRRHCLERLQTGLAETKASSELARGCTNYAEFRWISIVYGPVVEGQKWGCWGQGGRAELTGA